MIELKWLKLSFRRVQSSMYTPSGRNGERIEIGYAETALITSGPFCICSEIEYAKFCVRYEKFR